MAPSKGCYLLMTQVNNLYWRQNKTIALRPRFRGCVSNFHIYKRLILAGKMAHPCGYLSKLSVTWHRKHACDVIFLIHPIVLFEAREIVLIYESKLWALYTPRACTTNCTLPKALLPLKSSNITDSAEIVENGFILSHTGPLLILYSMKHNIHGCMYNMGQCPAKSPFWGLNFITIKFVRYTKQHIFATVQHFCFQILHT